MELLEAYTHSFVIKIWLEETAAEAARTTWRGQITHVPSGTRRHFEDFADISLFMMPYLQDMGVEISKYWRLRQWLRERKRSFEP